ncbi:MAG: type II toxin-antitoxin system RelE/ParE family toxin [Verrucomicrobia bacterium]|nr:type II toxin-antitoxin system RelE/ParE family toxin [Verrucomicrobiota bacterium]
MAATVHKTSRAEADIAGAITYLAERNPQAAMGFVNDLERLVDTIACFPELFPRQRRSTRPEWRDVRMAVLRRFNHLVFYTFERDTVIIRRVIHAARNEP